MLSLTIPCGTPQEKRALAEKAERWRVSVEAGSAGAGGARWHASVPYVMHPAEAKALKDSQRLPQQSCVFGTCSVSGRLVGLGS